MEPLLFILYINDIVNVSKDAELLLFADGTNMFLYDTDIYQLSAGSCKQSTLRYKQLVKAEYAFS